MPARFNTDELYGFIFNERMEDSDGIAAAAHTGDHRIGQASFGL